MCGGSVSEEEKEKRKQNEEIDKKLKIEKAALAKEVKMLLLGEIKFGIRKPAIMRFCEPDASC